MVWIILCGAMRGKKLFSLLRGAMRDRKLSISTPVWRHAYLERLDFRNYKRPRGIGKVQFLPQCGSTWDQKGFLLLSGATWERKGPLCAAPPKKGRSGFRPCACGATCMGKVSATVRRHAKPERIDFRSSVAPKNKKASRPCVPPRGTGKGLRSHAAPCGTEKNRFPRLCGATWDRKGVVSASVWCHA